MKAMLTTTAALALATLFVGPTVAQQPQQLVGTGQFCIKGASGPVKCEYQTMAQCEQGRPAGSSDQCMSRSQAEGTVGGPPPASPQKK